MKNKLKMSLPLAFCFLKHIIFLNPAPVVSVHNGVKWQISTYISNEIFDLFLKKSKTTFAERLWKLLYLLFKTSREYDLNTTTITSKWTGRSLKAKPKNSVWGLLIRFHGIKNSCLFVCSILSLFNVEQT